MPVYHYRCPECLKLWRLLLSVEASKTPGKCSCKAGAELVRVPEGPGCLKKETLDNGVMNKGLERFSDADRLFKERAGKK